MLEQLVVSSGHKKESRKFQAFFLGTAVLVLIGCFSVFVWSIMAADLTLTDDGLELSALIAPVPIPAAEPPKPEPPQQQQQQREQTSSKDEVAHRQSIIQRPEESPIVPDKISTAPMTQKARPASGAVKIGAGPETDGSSASVGPNRGDGGNPNGDGSSMMGTVAQNGNDRDEKPPVMPKKDPEPPKKPTMVSGGVLNGEAKYLPVPSYPTTAKVMHISDSVSVPVVIDEKGNVISAKAVSGHTLLRVAAETAARQAKFSSTYLTGQAVKVTGVIIYKFSNG